MYSTVVLLLIGLAAGLLSGFVGVGGGIIVIPALIIFLGYSQQQAQGTSLAFLLLPIGILAVLNYYKAGFVDIKAAAIMCVTFVIGSYFSSEMAVTIPQQYLKRGFGVFLLLVSLKFLLGK
jgi:Predicted permeases